MLDAGAGRGAVLYWLETAQSYKRIASAMGIELSQVAVESTPWPELLSKVATEHCARRAANAGPAPSFPARPRLVV